MKINFPYGKTKIPFEIEDSRISAILASKAEEYKPALSETELIKQALESPIGSERLSVLAKDAKKVIVISSDHTRPVPSRITMPVILSELRSLNKDVDITILIATGMHRATTHDELVDKYGKNIVENEKIVVHNAYIDEDMIHLGTLPSGGELWVNKLVGEADLLISEGFIEPHFFAGFSGGRKSVLPGVASKKTVLWNHNARFIAHNNARAGSIGGNPIHEDMLFAAKAAKLSFILNVVIDSDKKVIAAFSGNLEEAHAKGCEFVSGLAQVNAVINPIVMVTNGGYPLDQNMYQTVKGLTAAEACVEKDGVIIMVSSCSDGHGGEFFYKLLAEEKSAEDAKSHIDSVPPSDTQFDQWEAQILARILTKCTVIIVSKDCDPKMITDMHMLHAMTIEEALEKAESIVGKERITVIPDGVAVIVK
ncbi:MAG: nickel-dependent lactate racemase [Ruminococcaceae bacterium]|nr:nickel-dependent lactate racemase [Oscillospiraceae bacterium]